MIIKLQKCTLPYHFINKYRNKKYFNTFGLSHTGNSQNWCLFAMAFSKFFFIKLKDDLTLCT